MDRGARAQAGWANPCRHVGKYREQGRERFLSDSELARLGDALREAEQASPFVVAALRLLILTGARLNEILSLGQRPIRDVGHLSHVKMQLPNVGACDFTDQTLLELFRNMKPGDAPICNGGARFQFGVGVFFKNLSSAWPSVSAQHDAFFARLAIRQTQRLALEIHMRPLVDKRPSCMELRRTICA